MLRVNVFRSSTVLKRAVLAKRFATTIGQSTGQHAEEAKLTTSNKPYTVPKDVLIDTLKKFNTDIREKPDGMFEIRECKLCHKKNRDKPDNLYKLCVWPTGSYNCFRCSSSGNFYDLKDRAEMLVEESPTEDVKIYKVSGSAAAVVPKEAGQPPTYIIPNQHISYKPYRQLFPTVEQLCARKESLTDLEQRRQVRHYLNHVRGLNDEVLQKYGVGLSVLDFLSNENEWEPKVCISFPWQVRPDYLEGKLTKFTHPDDAKSEKEFMIVRSKFRALETKGLQRIQPKG
eukprot:CAMPEP_0184971394 /NCGR_PEP_ID=MMETSP1098-20130426/3645_1 /TAXON_ID=89044 /ORGANISM="Spumella elongata, Strain CCAP 955/1" /LENGTH=285 /DNA_ID=CAMNT_0027493511 /DNA_START=63 /DNA_END=916 /DNA_ORIENTATION=+